MTFVFAARLSRHLRALPVCGALCAAPILVRAADMGEAFSADAPVYVYADDMTYDGKNDVATATGDVRLEQNGNVVIADRTEYRRATDEVIAVGNVMWRRTDGSVVSADRASLSRKMSKGAIASLSAQFPNESRLTAAEGHKNGKKTVFKDVSFTPCPVCYYKGKKSTVWSVRAKRAALDETKESVSYRDMTFRLFDAPIMYLPYFSHPSPGASRKSGFLTPTYRNDSIFGVMATVPYYYNIKPEMDLELAPTFTSEEGPAMLATFRHLTRKGKYQFTASGTNPEKIDNTDGSRLPGREFRGHIEGNGEFDFDSRWSAGFDAKRATDDTYLRRYRYGSQDVLTSNAYTQFMTANSWMRADALSFQNLDADVDPAVTPLILPDLRFEWNGDRGEIIPGTELSFSGGGLLLERDLGSSTERVSGKFVSRTPWTTDGGHVFSAELSLRADVYHIRTEQSGQAAHSEESLRTIPEATLRWSYPMEKQGERVTYYIEPLVNVHVSPYGGNSEDVVNEDSQDVEFGATNVFSDNRYNGYDRVESGPRMDYGARASAYSPEWGEASVTLGQNLRLKPQQDFDPDSGLGEKRSDYVVGLGYSKDDVAAVNYETRIDADGSRVQSQSLYARMHLAPMVLEGEYLVTHEPYATSDVAFEKREVALAHAEIPVAEHWTVHAYGHHDLDAGKWIAAKGAIRYDGECYGAELGLSKEFTRDRDVEPSSTISFQLTLSNFGGEYSDGRTEDGDLP
ncbi:MAG: LPS assembly protein LptD [Rickettsiales bacterium]